MTSATISPACIERALLALAGCNFLGNSWVEPRCVHRAPGLLIQDRRRSAVRNIEQAGVPRSVAMTLTRHKTENVYRRYAIASETDLERLYPIHFANERRR
jgi:hypothetical protein